jgi:hypothetical protein
MKKIICFDAWTEYSVHFERHVALFEKEGYEVILVHYGSWGHDLNRPKEERLGRLLVRDIAYYSNSLIKVLKVEQPEWVLFLSTRSFINMAFNRYSRYLGIKTCLLYHGLVSVQNSTTGNTNPYSFSRLNYLMLIFKRIGKNLFLLIPNYIRSLIFTGASKDVWKEAFNFIWERISGRWTQRHYSDSATTIGCVWAKVDVVHMFELYRIPISGIYVIGNPDLLKFRLSENDVLFGRKNLRSKSNHVVYIETAFNNAGVVYTSNSDFIGEMINLKDSLEDYGLVFKLKLHPSNFNNEFIINELRKSQIDIITDDDYLLELKSALGAIVEPSSAIIVPCILGIPIFLNNVGRMASIPFGKMIYDYPGTVILRSMVDLAQIECTDTDNSTADYQRWIDLYAGNVPPLDISDRLLFALKANV